MPLMYRPHGVRKFFRGIEEGLREGYYLTYNDMAQAYKAQQQIPESVPEETPPPVPDVESPPPEPPAEHQDVDSAPLERVKELAQDFGIDPTQHHKTLRKQVREALSAQIGDHRPGV